MTFIRFTIAAAVAMVIVVAALVFYGQKRFEAPGPHGDPVVVMVKAGAGLGQTARMLENAGVVQSADLFRWVPRIKGVDRDIRAGEYEIPAHASMAEVLSIVRSGQVVQHRITLAEGLSSAQIIRLIMDTPTLSGPAPDVPPEGTLLPETYNHVRGTTRTEMVARMSAAMDARLRELWDNRDPEHPLTTPEEAVILASIVEKETGVAAERPTVAAVFLNRLRKGMRLQSDPTVVYAATGGEPIGRRLTRADLNRDSPYNTYRNHGLPPGPIANPGVDSLKAVLNPVTTDYLYFVADGTGGHAFARTLEDHNRNVRAWRQIRRDLEREAEKSSPDSTLDGETAEDPVDP